MWTVWEESKGPPNSRGGMEPRNGQLGNPGAREGGEAGWGPLAWGAGHLGRGLMAGY